MDDLLTLITDLSDDGIICVNGAGVITLFNRKAMQITGTAPSDNRAHPAGVIEPGDIVLIADNMLGDDDGELTPADLAAINLHDADLRPGDAIIAAGVYQNSSLEPLCRSCGQTALPSRMELRSPYLGLDLVLAIDSDEHQVVIQVGGLDFSMPFQKSVGNIVVVDGATGAVKFFQSRGSTIRREDVRDLLIGHPFAAKGVGTHVPNMIGRNFFSMVLPGRLTEKLSEILSGRAQAITHESYTINKRLMLTSIHPIIQAGHIEGAAINLIDLSEMGKLLRERNEFIAKVEEASLNVDNHAIHVPPEAFSTFAGSAPPIQRVKYLAYRAALAKCNVIITGESGTGKSQLAQEIHRLSRPDGPFVEVNCASIPHDLFESELFGYVGGAFTGALAAGKPGYFEQAEGGTLFLDELAELPPNIQVKLLYVIQNKRFYRVGSTKPMDVDVRILCATNKDLREEVRQGRFREDLFYRVNVFPIEIPPLRARISDIYLLSKSLTEHTCAEYGLPPKQLSGKALEKLLGYDFPGNIRELGNVIERAISISDGPIIYPDSIQLEENVPPPGEMPETAPPVPTQVRPLRETVALAEEAAIRAALAYAMGDKKVAMESLGMKKTVFYEKLQRYRIEV